MFAIEGKDINFRYEYGRLVLQEIDLTVKPGSLTAFLGLNGSGKSTLAKLFNALLPLQDGQLKVAGIDVSNPKDIWKLRRCCGMVFQNPDNQFVSSVLEEDIAFGLENYEVSADEIPAQVSRALMRAGLSGFEKRSPHTMSGGQKQRAALAGVLVLSPDILIFDECTSMLDPEGRKEVLNAIHDLHTRDQKTVIMITHYVEEAVHADKVCLMQDGKIAACGSPREILTDRELLDRVGFLPPFPVRVYEDLKASGITLKNCPLTNEELVEELCRLH